MASTGTGKITNQPVDDRGTNETEGRALIKHLRDRGFEGNDEMLAVALGRPLAEVPGHGHPAVA